jgi:hypothetical protein
MKFWQTSLYKVDGFHLLISLSKCSHSSSLSFNFNEREPEITIWVGFLVVFFVLEYMYVNPNKYVWNLKIFYILIIFTHFLW